MRVGGLVFGGWGLGPRGVFEAWFVEGVGKIGNAEAGLKILIKSSAIQTLIFNILDANRPLGLHAKIR
jgi:hypothetical protein